MQTTEAESNNYPYPVIAVTDLAKNYSADHFRFAIGQCRDVIAKLIAEDNSSDQQIARVRILRYLDLQLSRAVRWVEDEADLMASVMRSLIELKFWANFVSESPEKATQFLHESQIDGREMFEHLKKLVPDDTYELIQFPKGKRVSVEPSGEKEDLIWKMCSKLIHPSSWVINDLAGTVYSAEHRKVLSIYVLFYGWGIVRLFHEINWV